MKNKDMDCTTKYGRAFYNGKKATEKKILPKPQYKNTPGSTLTHNHIKEMDRDNRRRDEGRII